MKVWTEMYGADADGNRGVLTTYWELEGTEVENEEIARILYEQGFTTDDDGTTTIEYQDMEIEVDVEEYMADIMMLEIKAEIEEIAEIKYDEIVCIYKDEDDQYLIKGKAPSVVLNDIKYNKYIAVPF